MLCYFMLTMQFVQLPTKSLHESFEKADTPNYPVEQTTRAVAPAPASDWPMQLAAAAVRWRYVLAEVRVRQRTAVDGCEGFRSLTPFKATAKGVIFQH
ncbi:hypothetical protein B5X24_HaOG201743 [Helicoverpa armigera]|nr:hypothetical protein B5X24_HaOG201743 [Helicoverpa armigera]